MEYVELQESEEEQYNQELKYLDEPNQSSIYSEIDEDTESIFKARSDIFQPSISSQNIRNRSKSIRNEQPMDVEPLEKKSIKESNDSLSNEKEILDIEDPW